MASVPVLDIQLSNLRRIHHRYLDRDSDLGASKVLKTKQCGIQLTRRITDVVQQDLERELKCDSLHHTMPEQSHRGDASRKSVPIFDRPSLQVRHPSLLEQSDRQFP